MAAYRYAVYAVPEPGHPLEAAAAAWLGRDARGGADGEGAPFADLLGDARRYGFHGTMKAPFRLAAGRDEIEFLAAAASLIEPPLPVALAVSDDLGFPALRPVEPMPALDRLAASCVCDLDGFRSPPTPEDLAHRLSAPLTSVQKTLLAAWGYPYVLEEFRFHMTLGARAADPARHAGLIAAAERHFAAALEAPVPLTLAIFVEPERGAPFRLWRDLAIPARNLLKFSN